MSDLGLLKISAVLFEAYLVITEVSETAGRPMAVFVLLEQSTDYAMT